MKALVEILGQAAAKGRMIHFLPPYRAEHSLKLDALLESARPGRGQDFPGSRRVRHRQRSVKSDEEVPKWKRP